jgi:hypothetical protein
MKNVLRVVLAICFTILLSAPALAQTAIPPPPKPADSGPSLEATMQFIQEKLSLLEEVKYTLYGHTNEPVTNQVIPFVVEITNVTIDPESCNIGYHWKVSVYDATAKERDMQIPLRDVQMTALSTLEQYSKNSYGRDGNNILVDRTDPPVFVLQVLRKDGPANDFDFIDKDLANRVAKALMHAMVLCGGGSKPEPF